MEDLKFNLKKQIISRLNLEEVTPENIIDSAPLFGDGLGLDSIDALEIIVLLQQEYGLKVQNAEEGKKVLQSIDSLAAYINEKKK